jgi:hypothetical protein
MSQSDVNLPPRPLASDKKKREPRDLDIAGTLIRVGQRPFPTLGHSILTDLKQQLHIISHYAFAK